MHALHTCLRPSTPIASVRPTRGNDRQRDTGPNFAICFFITRLPSYLLQLYGFSLASLGTWGMPPALFFSGRASDNDPRPPARRQSGPRAATAPPRPRR
ncbi:hypothetical protein EMIT0111MI5_10119 [Burkholderia sp. IT-111MI5]